MPAATCDPGQGKVPAVAPGLIVLRPETGGFGDATGTVRLVSNENGQGEPMTLKIWSQASIEAQLPSRNPGTGKETETFKIRIKPAGGPEVIYEATPIKVRGDRGSGWYPPTHDPGA